MKIKVENPEAYIDQLPEDRKQVICQLRKIIKKNLPKGFVEMMNFGMIGYVVPHSLYPKGYHCDSNLPLPFINIASQKNFVAVYHMGIYTNEKLHNWFVDRYQKDFQKKLDAGKSCLRFKHLDQIPYELIGKLCTKMSVAEWIEVYERRKKKKCKFKFQIQQLKKIKV